MIKKSKIDAFPALLVGTLCSVLLRGPSTYQAGAGLLTALPAVLVLWFVSALFSAGFARVNSFFTSFGLAAILFYSAGIEILRLWKLYHAAYDGTVTLLCVGVAVLLPVLYLRRVPAIAQSANAVLLLLAVTSIILVISIMPRLRVYDLQVVNFEPKELMQSFSAQIFLAPELLLLPLYQKQTEKKKISGGLLCLSALFMTFEVAANLLVELVYGAAAMQRENPLHAAAACGEIAIFSRLEWLQLLIWTLAVSIREALLLYGISIVLQGKSEEPSGATMPVSRYVFFSMAMIGFCFLVRDKELSLLLRVERIGIAIYALLVIVTGGILLCGIRKPLTRQ